MKLRSKVASARSSRLPSRLGAVELGDVELERQVVVGDPLAVARWRRRARSGSRARGCCPATSSATACAASIRRCRAIVLVEARVVALEEEVDELRQILDALAQRRQAHRNHVEAVEEVLAERAVLDGALEVDVGRRNQAERRLDRLACRRPARSRLPESRAAAWPAGRACRSPISSRNSVPPLASSNLPMRCCSAPVNAPLSWPNSVLSTSSRGMAARLTAMNGGRSRPIAPTRGESGARAAPCRCRSRRE